MKKQSFLFLSAFFFNGMAFQKVVLAEGKRAQRQAVCLETIRGNNPLHENDFLGMGAGEVFIRFAESQLSKGDLKSTMGIHWEGEAKQALNGWSLSSAVNFLNFLVQRIGPENALKRIKSLSYFKTMRWESFIPRVSLFEEYIGRGGVNFRLSHSLEGFNRGSVDEIKAVVAFVERYIGKKAVIEKMKQDLRGFSMTKLSELKAVVAFVEKYIGEEAVIEKMKQDLRGFSVAKLSDLKVVVAFVERYIGKKAVIEKMKRDLYSFSRVKIAKLNQLQAKWGHRLMKENLKKYNLQNSLFSSSD